MRQFLLFAFSLVCFSEPSYSQESPGWTKKNNFPSGPMEKAASFAIGEKGYAGLGTDNSGFRKDFWQYDPGKDAWNKMEAFPGDARVSSVSFSINGKGYAGTGLTASQISEAKKDFWEYDPQKDSWVQKADLPGKERYGAVGFAIGSKGYIALGANKAALYTDVWEYDPASNKWTKKSDFPASGRADASSFVIGTEAYVLLGQGKELIPNQKDCWKFSQAKNEWKKVSDFPGTARIGALAFSYKTKGFIAGGFNGTLKRYQDFWEYDAPSDKWRQKADVPYGTRDYIFSFVINDAAYVCTGHGQKSNSGFEVWKYDLPKIAGNTFAMGGTLLLGSNRIPIGNIDVKIYNAKNELIKTVQTGLFGSFLFMDLPNNQEYTLEAMVTDPHMKKSDIFLVSRENEPIATLNVDNNFRFKVAMEEKSKLQLMKVENKNMRMNLKGKLVLSSGDKKSAFAEASLSLIDSQQQVVQTAETDENGNFLFNYVPVDSNLYLNIDAEVLTQLPKGTTVLLMDQNDNIVDKATSGSSKFLLVSLPPEQNKLSSIYIEDPWIQATLSNPTDGMKVIENVYFDVAKWELLPEAKTVLNKVAIMMKNNPKISIEVSAHTDARGDAKSNLELSEKRAQEAKKYMVSQDVDANRISAKGYGETKLINRCADGVECTEEEHSQNRRMEFKIKTK